MLAPPEGAVARVVSWLRANGAIGSGQIAVNAYGDMVSATMGAAQVEAMLHTTLATYTHRVHGESVRITRVAAADAQHHYSVPREIGEVVSMIGDIARFPALRRHRQHQQQQPSTPRSAGGFMGGFADWPADCGKKCFDHGVGLIGKATTPDVLAKRYAVPRLTPPTAAAAIKGSVAVAEFTNVYWDAKDLDVFTTSCNATGRFVPGYNASVQRLVGPANKPRRSVGGVGE